MARFDSARRALSSIAQAPRGRADINAHRLGVARDDRICANHAARRDARVHGDGDIGRNPHVVFQRNRAADGGLRHRAIQNIVVVLHRRENGLRRDVIVVADGQSALPV